MPILRSLNQRCITDEEFRMIDKALMRHAYDLQNQFGRLFDERVYENELADRLRADGFEVETQVPVTVSHGSFTKTYYLDLVVNHMLYELKVVERRVSAHKAQCLHYAMLQNLRLVKLINLGEQKVGGELFQNTLQEAERHHPRLRNSGWRPLDEPFENLVRHQRCPNQTSKNTFGAASGLARAAGGESVFGLRTGGCATTLSCVPCPL